LGQSGSGFAGFEFSSARHITVPDKAFLDGNTCDETAFAVTVPGLCKQLGWTKNVSIYKVSYYNT